MFRKKLIKYKLKCKKEPVPCLKGQYIHTLSGQYDFLGNNFYSPFVYNGKAYDTITQAISDLERNNDIINNEVVLRLIANKFACNEGLKQRLLQTGDAIIIGNGSEFHRLLGKMLMSVRNGLRNPMHCKLFNLEKVDGSCCEMKCEFCDPFYDERRKQWWFHLPTRHYTYASLNKVRHIYNLINVDDRIQTRVVNVKYDEYDVYIGRGSIYGNPFKIGKDGDRNEVIDKFESYLRSNKKLLDQLKKLKNKRLGCHCNPERCHGDVIAEIIENSDY